MSRKIMKEALKWQEAGIISQAQFEQIAQFYPKKQGFGYLLPFFSGLLIGLGIIAWIASNWEHMNQWLQLGSVLAMIITFYAFGIAFLRRDNLPAGLGFIAMGVMSFGAGFLAIAQTFQIGSRSVLPFLLWFAVAYAMAWMLQSKLLYLISFFISFSMLFFWDSDQPLLAYLSFAFFVGGSYFFIKMYGAKWLWWFFAFGLLPYSLAMYYFLFGENLGDYWLLVIFIGFYLISTFFKEFIVQLPFRLIGLYGMFFITLINNVDNDSYRFWTEFGNSQILYLVVLLILLGGIAYHLIQVKDRLSLLDGLVLIPWFIWNVPSDLGLEIVDLWALLSLVVLGAHGLLLMWRDSVLGSRFWGIAGIVQFLIITFSTFTFDWDFNLKIVVFLFAGLILFLFSTRFRAKKNAPVPVLGHQNQEVNVDEK